LSSSWRCGCDEEVKKVREEGQTEMSVKRALKRGEMAQYFP
jgi:hypothetical protein